jgi:hypothetical protein
MEDTKTVETDSSNVPGDGHIAVADTLPRGWMYKQLKIGPWTLPWFASPKIQLGMVAFVCFLCPGMFNALSGLGGGGRSATDTSLADNMVSCL